MAIPKGEGDVKHELIDRNDEPKRTGLAFIKIEGHALILLVDKKGETYQFFM